MNEAVANAAVELVVTELSIKVMQDHIASIEAAQACIAELLTPKNEPWWKAALAARQS